MVLKIEAQHKAYEVKIKMPFVSVSDAKDICLSTEVLCLLM